ncbi:Uncharacterised protein [Mycobacteroides abscessus subsp. abscessus]|nr:Uncharacterised protein [Mycobacteroides abscessus subsp. abscessus]
MHTNRIRRRRGLGSGLGATGESSVTGVSFASLKLIDDLPGPVDVAVCVLGHPSVAGLRDLGGLCGMAGTPVQHFAKFCLVGEQQAFSSFVEELTVFIGAFPHE